MQGLAGQQGLFGQHDKAIVMFSSVLHQLKIQKPTSQQGRKITKSMQML
jgi:hypothetical protein